MGESDQIVSPLVAMTKVRRNWYGHILPALAVLFLLVFVANQVYEF